MVEPIATLLAWLCAAPLVWRACDSRLTRARLAPAGTPPPHMPATDVPGFLDSVARSVRAGESNVTAVLAAPSCSRSMTSVQRDLKHGLPLRDALERFSPEVLLLRSCLHHGVLSADALEHAARSERRYAAGLAETRAAVASARHSMRVLTRLPFMLLAAALVLSGHVRSGIIAPLPLLSIGAGCTASAVGAAWLRRLVGDSGAGAATVAEQLCRSVAAHLSAGGTVESAVSVAAPLHPAVAATAAGLAAGHPFTHAMNELSGVCPELGNVLVAAHRDGRPLVAAVSGLADDIAARSAADTRAVIARLPVRATVPLVGCVLPAFVLVAMVPVGIVALGQLRG